MKVILFESNYSNKIFQKWEYKFELEHPQNKSVFIITSIKAIDIKKEYDFDEFIILYKENMFNLIEW